jgi:1-acyl-sn-glycerol-3-phosphate acyltransferase
MYFPVRSSFWYDSLLGIGTNAATSCMSMYPPIFRAAEKREATRAGLDFLARELADPGVVVGMHPEGTRSKQPDPYALLPPEQSFGRVVLLARPTVIPVFVNGVGNSLVRECVSGIRGKAPKIIVAFGAPVDLSEFDGADPTRLRTQIAVGQRVLDAIGGLGRKEQALRARRSCFD